MSDGQELNYGSRTCMTCIDRDTSGEDDPCNRCDCMKNRWRARA